MRQCGERSHRSQDGVVILHERQHFTAVRVLSLQQRGVLTRWQRICIFHKPFHPLMGFRSASLVQQPSGPRSTIGEYCSYVRRLRKRLRTVFSCRYARVCQCPDCSLDCADRLGCRGHYPVVHIEGHAQAAQINIVGVIQWHRDDGRVDPIDSRDYRKHQHQILDISCHRPYLSRWVECAHIERDDVACSGHPASGGFYSCDAAKMRRYADAAASVAAQVQRRTSRRDNRRCASAAAPWRS